MRAAQVNTCLLFLLLFFRCLAVAAQDSLAVLKLRLEHLTADDGLSQGSITAIVQDKSGFMWFGTKDGLNRYDGYQFKVYRNNMADSNSIADNHIISIVTDSRGLLWIRYFKNKVDVFDPVTETAWHLTDALKKENVMLDALFNFMPVAAGDVYLQDKTGYFKITVTAAAQSNGFKYSFNIRDLSRLLPVVNGKSSYTWAFISASNKLYLSYKDSIVVISNPDISKPAGMKRYHYTYFSQVHPPGNTHLNYPTRIQYNEVCAEDTLRHRLLIAGINSFTLFDERSQTKTDSVILGRYDVKTLINESNVMFDSKGRVWLSALPTIVYDPASRSVIKILAKDFNIMEEMLANCTFSQDKSGTLFIGTNGYGLLKYNSHVERFQHVAGRDQETLSLNGIYQDRDEKYLWLKKNNMTLTRFNRKTGALDEFFHSDLYLQKNTGLLSAESKIIAGSFYADESGYWILSTQQNLLYHLDAQLQVINKIALTSSSLLIHGILTPAGPGRLWLAAGNWDNHVLFLIDTEHGRELRNFPIPFGKSTYTYPFNSAMVTDKNKNVWLGTIEGLFCFTVEKESWKHFKHIDKDSTSLPLNTIFSLCNDPVAENILWVGTNNGGLVKFDKNNGKAVTFNSASGLPNDVIYGILADQMANLWISTNNGIARFNPVTKEIKYFTEKDGLQGNEFNRYASCTLQSGEMAFGGINGLNIFNPGQINTNQFHPRVLFTGFKIGNKEVAMHTGTAVLTKPVFVTKEISLDHTQNFITFSFISTDYSAKEKNLYQYQLVGLDKDWQPATRLNEATYTNLDPGTYFFKVRASNSDGVWSPNEALLKIVIASPWWATWWFRIFCVLAIAGMLYALFRFRLKQRTKLLLVRDNIARDLHDEIGSTLSSISLYGESAKKVMHGNEAAGNILSKINASTTEMMEAMNDIVWAVNTQNDRFDNLANRMRNFAVQLAEAKDIELHFMDNEQLPKLPLNMNQRKNIYLIFKEAVNNAVKYSGCRKLWVSFEIAGNHLTMCVKDDGHGFEKPGQGNTGGNGIRNMKKRAADINAGLQLETSAGKGSSIILKTDLKRS